MCPSAAPTNATLPLVGAAPASSVEPLAATGRRQGRNLEAARDRNKRRHEQRNEVELTVECPDCWSRNELETFRFNSKRGKVLRSRCQPCIDYNAGRIDAETWARRVLRTHDRKVTA